MPETKQRKKVSRNSVINEYDRVLSFGQKDYNLPQHLGNESGGNGVWRNELNTTMSVQTLKGLLFGEDWPYICCDRIASKIAAQPLMIMRKITKNGKKATEVVMDNPVQAMLENPNEYQTYYQWMYSLVMDLMCTGNAVNWVAFMSKQILHIPIENIQIDSDTGLNGGIKCYRVLSTSQDDYPNLKGAISIPPAQVCHVRRPNPSSMIWGLSPFIPGRKAVLFNKHSTEYLNNYYIKGAQPGLVLEIGNEANEKNVLRLLRSFEAAHTGRTNQRRNMILPKGVTSKDASHKLADQQLKDYLVLNRETIINLLQVPKHELSIAESGSLGSEEYKTALRNFWSGPLKGTMGMIAQSLTKTLRPLLGEDLFLEFDLYDVEVLQDDKTSKADLATKMLSTHSVNEIRAEIYELAPIPGGEHVSIVAKNPMAAAPGVPGQPVGAQVPSDTGANQITNPTQSLNSSQVTSIIEIVTQVNSGLLPVDSAIAIVMVSFAIDEQTARAIVGQGKVAVPESPLESKSLLPVDTKEVLLRNIERLHTVLKAADGWWSKREALVGAATDKAASDLTPIVTDLLSKQGDAVADAVAKTIKKKSFIQKAATIPSKAELKRRIIEALDNYKSQYVEDVGDVLSAQMDIGYDAALIVPFNIPNTDQMDALKARNEDGRRQTLDERNLKTFSYMNETTTEQIMSLIDAGIADQNTVDQIVRSIRVTLADPEMTKGRVERIVRTETLTASSIGQNASMQDLATLVPNLKKVWINANDDRVRGQKETDQADHFSLQGVVVDFDKPFTDPRSGTKLMYPRDTAGGPGDVINCRCNFIYLPAENAADLGFEQIHTEADPT